MVRRYDDMVQVRPTSGEPDAEPEPDAFVWRGRLYVVRAVLARWHERRAWWRDPAASALLGLQADQPDGRSVGDHFAGDHFAGDHRVGDDPAGTGPSSATVLAGECQVWRVEAAAGRSSPLGVYDLIHTPGTQSTWHLARVAD